MDDDMNDCCFLKRNNRNVSVKTLIYNNFIEYGL